MNRKFIPPFTQLSTGRTVLLLVATVLLLAYILCLPRPLFRVAYSTVVADCNGKLLGARISADGQWRFPPRTTTPLKIKQCLTTFEDKHFYHHWGVNPLAIGRAMVQNMKNKRIVSGGSTLTMQTIRLARNKPRTWNEKLIEMVLATRLEFQSSKEEILSLYVSHAPFGGNVVGLDAAAWRYFGHPAEELSWAESAMLAVLPNAPSMIHLSKERKALLNKRNRLLRQLLDRGTIDPSAYELAISEPLPNEPHPLPQVAPHLVSRFYQERKGEYSATTIDKDIQVRIESLAERWSNEFGRSDIRNLAILIIDIPSNSVVAYCGNVHFEQKLNGNQVDIIQAPRSTGSILKPFLHYAMLQEGSLLPQTLLADIPININGYTPQNFSQQYEGAMPASEALARSLNIPSVRLLQQYGVPKFHSFLRQIGLSTLHRPSSHYGLSLILGGAEATLWDVTSAYANMGRSILNLPQAPCALLSSEAHHRASDNIEQRASTGTHSPKKTAALRAQQFQAGAAWQTLEALTEVNRPEEIDWKSIPSMHPIAWKTGTSFGFRDAWAVGVNTQYAIGVWVGNATGEGKPGLIGARTAGPVLFDLFNLLPAPARWFERPPHAFVEAEVCRQSGHLKNRFCPDTDIRLILPTGLKTAACPYHHLITLSADETQRIYEHCANAEPTIQKAWFTLPPVCEWYYKQHHPEYTPLPPFKAGCGEDALQSMQFIYPPTNTRITLPKQLDGSLGFVVAELAHNNPNTAIFWHLDNSYLTQTHDFHKISLQPSPGKHTLTAVDDQGNTATTTFFIQ